MPDDDGRTDAVDPEEDKDPATESDPEPELKEPEGADD